MKNTKALLIIDMQKGAFTPEAKQHDTNGVVNRINQLSQLFRTLEFPVLFIQHNGKKFNMLLPYSTEWQLLDELNVDPTDYFINKESNDAFYNTQLQSILTKLKIKELYISGAATDFCVNSTIQSALVKDFFVVAIEDAHTTGLRPYVKTEDIIKHYNWVWKNLIPTNGKITVKNVEQVKNHLTK